MVYIILREVFGFLYAFLNFLKLFHVQARIALERRKFLKNAETAVQRQAMWSDLAHEMTAEFRGLCAEEVKYPASVYLGIRSII